VRICSPSSAHCERTYLREIKKVPTPPQKQFKLQKSHYKMEKTLLQFDTLENLRAGQ